jgi:hypothetical protein
LLIREAADRLAAMASLDTATDVSLRKPVDSISIQIVFSPLPDEQDDRSGSKEFAIRAAERIQKLFNKNDDTTILVDVDLVHINEWEHPWNKNASGVLADHASTINDNLN